MKDCGEKSKANGAARQLSGLKPAFRAIFSAGDGDVTLRVRLTAFFILFLLSVMLVLLFILYATGVFSASLKQNSIFIETELSVCISKIESSLGTLAVEGVALAKSLMRQYEYVMDEKGIAEKDRNLALFTDEPEFINSVLRSCLETLHTALEKNVASGAFMILDTTINPALDYAEFSRSGLYLRNTEPNAINRINPNIRYLRGPMVIAHEHGIDALPQWEMEVSVSPGDFFHVSVDAARSLGGDISRLYRWNPQSILEGDFEKAMFLTVPLIAKNGAVLGVCGFEISTLLFKLQNSPDSSVYSRAFTLLAPLTGEDYDLRHAMFAGKNIANLHAGGAMKAASQRGGMTVFEAQNAEHYVGLSREIKIYPKNAAFGNEHWAVAVLLSEDDLTRSIASSNASILSLLCALLIVSAGAAIYISFKFLSPLQKAIEDLKQRPPGKYAKTNIREINDLFAFLAGRDTESKGYQPPPAAAGAAMDEQTRSFFKRLQTLSRAEKSVFNLYVQGYDAKEITQLLCLSINTIKTHNKRIYDKLEVASRKELMAYLRNLKMNGVDFKGVE